MYKSETKSRKISWPRLSMCQLVIRLSVLYLGGCRKHTIKTLMKILLRRESISSIRLILAPIIVVLLWLSGLMISAIMGNLLRVGSVFMLRVARKCFKFVMNKRLTLT